MSEDPPPAPVPADGPPPGPARATDRTARAAEREAEREAGRLEAALGRLLDGGVVDAVEHVGATAAPLPALPAPDPETPDPETPDPETPAPDAPARAPFVVDLFVSAWPAPLEPAAVRTLAALGYAREPDAGGPLAEGAGAGHGGRIERFARPADRAGAPAVRLLVAAGDAEALTDARLVRDLLRARPDAARAWAAERRALRRAAGGDPERYRRAKLRPLAELARAARRRCVEEVGFAPLREAARELEGLDAPWAFAGGWALDLHLGRVERVHHDVDVTIFRRDQDALRAHLEARGWRFLAPDGEGALPPWRPGERVEAPRHQLHAHRDGDFLDVLLAEGGPETWAYRRDPRVRRAGAPWRLRSGDGLPYLAPGLVLLFKAGRADRPPRGRDAQDFERLLPALDAVERAWLRTALERTLPGHAWSGRLGEGSAPPPLPPAP